MKYGTLEKWRKRVYTRREGWITLDDHRLNRLDARYIEGKLVVRIDYHTHNDDLHVTLHKHFQFLPKQQWIADTHWHMNKRDRLRDVIDYALQRAGYID